MNPDTQPPVKSEDQQYNTDAWREGFQSGYDQVINEMLYWLAETGRKTIPAEWVTSRQTNIHSKRDESLRALIKQEAERHANAVIGEDAFIDYSQKELYGDGQIATLENENNLRKYQRLFNHYPLKEVI